MAEITELEASARERVGKGAARGIRRTGRVPGVIYGNKLPPETITMDYKEIYQQYLTGNLLSTVYMLNVAGKKIRVIPREVQLDPVRDFVMHVDFLRLAKDAEVTVEVSVAFVNEEESPGLKRGGVMNIVRHTIEVVCPADAIPESLEADLTGLEIGDSFHISSIELPENVRPTITDRDFTIVTIAGAVASDVDEEEVEEEGEEIEAGEVPATSQKDEEE